MGIGGALRKIHYLEKQRGNKLERIPVGAASHLFFAQSSQNWFSTHPDISNRMRRIFGKPMPPIAAHDALDVNNDPSKSPKFL